MDQVDRWQPSLQGRFWGWSKHSNTFARLFDEFADFIKKIDRSINLSI
jgi:hypothetical protein